ncbi:hypothetical protein [Streptomyces sp. YIM 132580]|uniref:hypothetical protein n=1 Tax=Streptomyces sp. YIM 132580 TaxID=2691958 RepID=UPI00136967F2|nr:hypothetical protein [Streptomyces sp. YIM 132580]MXG28189.1 hypothetical protein [Streptomyces sp. YIM 132580]
MYRTSPRPKPRRSPRTAAALTAGIALAAVTLLAGPAAAATPQGTAPAVPATHVASAGGHEQVTRLICTELAGVLGHLPPESGPARVCKLVNGWD